MLNKLSLFVSVIFLSMPFNSFAMEKMSCSELEGTANDPDDLADAFYAASSLIKEDDLVNVALADVVDSLHIIVASEREGDLSGYAHKLDRVWENMDSDNFADALDGVINSLDRLLKRDCI